MSAIGELVTPHWGSPVKPKSIRNGRMAHGNPAHFISHLDASSGIESNIQTPADIPTANNATRIATRVCHTCQGLTTLCNCSKKYANGILTTGRPGKLTIDPRDILYYTGTQPGMVHSTKALSSSVQSPSIQSPDAPTASPLNDNVTTPSVSSFAPSAQDARLRSVLREGMDSNYLRNIAYRHEGMQDAKLYGILREGLVSPRQTRLVRESKRTHQRFTQHFES